MPEPPKPEGAAARGIIGPSALSQDFDFRKARDGDIAAISRIDRWLPINARPYARLMRLDRPIGTWLLLFPCWWGLGLAAAAHGHAPDLWAMILFALGAIVMRGAGCTINDMADRDYDRRVARTATRPLASGALSMRAAWAALAVQLGVGFLVLIQFDGISIAIGIAALPLVFAYPFMKRITYWPQAFLGLTFNWGVFVGWSVGVGGGLGLAPFLLYVGSIAWTLFYDTIYAHQDTEDDALIGVKSSALLLGSQTRPWLYGFGVAAVLLWAAAGATIGVGWPWYLGVAAAAGHLFWQARVTRLDQPSACLTTFRSNRWIGLIVFVGSIAATLLTVE